MISKGDKFEVAKNGISFTINHPILVDDEDFEFWIDVHYYIKESESPIVVTHDFWKIEELLKNRERYVSELLRYTFWFENEEDYYRFRLFYMRLVFGKTLKMIRFYNG